MNRWLKSMILCLVLCATFLFSHGHLMSLGCVILAITAVFCLIMFLITRTNGKSASSGHLGR